MPENAYNETYDEQGNVVNSQLVEISDDVLLARELYKEANDYHTLALQAYHNWSSLTTAQRNQVLKFLLGYYLVSGEMLGLFRIE